jgi:hypothetical protein
MAGTVDGGIPGLSVEAALRSEVAPQWCAAAEYRNACTPCSTNRARDHRDPARRRRGERAGRYQLPGQSAAGDSASPLRIHRSRSL